VVSSLAVTSWGTGPLIVLCHGFTQTSRSWGAFGHALGVNHSVLAVDLPGHGRSGALHQTLEETASSLLETIGEKEFDLIGYSLGGRVALTTALMKPPTLRRMVLIGATAGIEDPVLRDERRHRDEKLAETIIADDDVSSFVDQWLRQPLFATLPADASERTSRLTNTSQGLAQSLQMAGTGTQRPSWEQLAQIETPTLILAGVRDDRFCAHGIRLAAGLAHGQFSMIPGAGHACHLEQPNMTTAIVHRFLSHAHPTASPSASNPPVRS